jgi:hypothetical protein
MHIVIILAYVWMYKAGTRWRVITSKNSAQGDKSMTAGRDAALAGRTPQSKELVLD